MHADQDNQISESCRALQYSRSVGSLIHQAKPVSKKIRSINQEEKSNEDIYMYASMHMQGMQLKSVSQYPKVVNYFQIS